MKKTITQLTLILVFLLAGACNEKKAQEFSIYISDSDQPIEINTATKFLDIEDIIVYDWEKHEIQITENAAKRFEDLMPPVNGLHFAVFLGKDSIYDGYIWPFYSSLSFDGIIIEYPLLENNLLRIKKGYPGDDFFSGKDLRSDERIYESLLKDQKITP